MERIEEIRSFLLGLRSMDDVHTLAQEARESELVLALLWQLALEDEHPVSWYAIWAMGHAAKVKKSILIPYSSEIHTFLPKTTLNGTRRELIKFLEWLPLDDERSGAILEICNAWIFGKQPVAIQAGCIRYMTKLLKAEPFLAGEFKAIASELSLMYSSAGMKSVLKKLNTAVTAAEKKIDKL